MSRAWSWLSPRAGSHADIRGRHFRTERFEEGLPDRGRALIEAAYVAALVFAASLSALGSVAALLTPAALLVGGFALVQPWTRRHGGPLGRVVATIVLAVSLTVATLVERPGTAEHARIGAMATFASHHLFAMLALRGIAAIAVVVLLTRADGQRVSSLGLVRDGLARELGVGALATIGAFAADVLSAIPFAVFMIASGKVGGAGGSDVHRRAEGLNELIPRGGVLAFAFTAVFAAAFEEIVFRGFLMGRLKRVSGSWLVSLVIASAVFGSGHVYEGFYAVFQTFVLGVFFGVLVLWRGRTESAIVAHAAFDAIIFAVAKVVLTSHAMQDALKSVPGG